MSASAATLGDRFKGIGRTRRANVVKPQKPIGNAPDLRARRFMAFA
ncbi:MAG: hypothetical protein H7203_12415, partial [Rhizobacter sp.]|nr:hypothetical protein [Burkholderiales bacterium]